MYDKILTFCDHMQVIGFVAFMICFPFVFCSFMFHIIMKYMNGDEQ